MENGSNRTWTSSAWRRLEVPAAAAPPAPAPPSGRRPAASGPANTSPSTAGGTNDANSPPRARRAVAHLAQLAPGQEQFHLRRPSIRCGRRTGGPVGRGSARWPPSPGNSAPGRSAAPGPGRSAHARQACAAIVSVDWLISIWRHASRQTSSRTVRNSSMDCAPSDYGCASAYLLMHNITATTSSGTRRVSIV